MLVGKVVPFLKQIIEEQCKELGLDMLALEVMPDHIHLFVSATPTHLPSRAKAQGILRQLL